MRKIVFKVLAVLVIFVSVSAIISCQKEDPFEQQNAGKNGYIKVITLSGSKGNTITMLEFPDVNAYESKLAELESEYETIEDNFVEKYNNLDDEALNDKEEEIGFNNQLPFVEFEKQMGFYNSMRQAFVALEKEWLNNEELNPETDPNLIYPFSTAEMTLLNKNGEVKIGKAILKLTKDGFVEFTDGDVEKLIRFNEGDMTVLDEPNVITNLSKDVCKCKSANCKSWVGEVNWHSYASNKMVRKSESFHSYPWRGVSTVKIISYKKRGSSWRRYRMNLGVANFSRFYDTSCKKVKAQGWTGWKYKRRKSLSISFSYWGAFPSFRAKNGASVLGYFKYAGYNTQDWLSW